MNIFVGNLNFQTEENQLQDVFAQFGTVSSVKIMIDKYTNRPRGFAFVEMANDAEAQSAIERLNGSTVDGRAIVVNEAKPREERSNNGYANKRSYNNRY